MTRDDLLAMVRSEAAKVLGIPAAEIVADANIVAVYGLDSLELMEIGTRLESALKLRIDPNELTNAQTVADVADYLYASMADR